MSALGPSEGRGLLTPEHTALRTNRLATVCLLAALASCHDARRENPFDPVRTPAVELTATLDDSTATATLTWTRYAGSAPFGHYLVLRSVEILGGQQVDTLTAIDDAGQTAFVDSLLIHGTSYTYRVSAVNSDGFEVPSTAVEVGPVGLPAVRITGLEFDSGRATATLQWTPYAGRGFAAYHIRRSTPELAPADVVVLTDPAATAYVDRNLHGATEYTYQVVVRTDRGEEVASQGQAGGVHRLLAEWPLPVEPGEYVRLYARTGSGLRVLATRPGTADDKVRTLVYGLDGSLLEETVLPPLTGTGAVNVSSRSAAMALDAAGLQTLCLLQVAGAALAPLPLREEVWEPFAAALETLNAGSARILGQVSLKTAGRAAFRSPHLWVNDIQVLSEEWEDFPSGLLQGRVNGWEFSGDEASVALGALFLVNATAMSADPSWESDRIRFEAVVVMDPVQLPVPGIQLGGDTLSRFTLWLLRPGQAGLEWACPSCDGEDRAPATFAEPLPVVPLVRYRLTLEVSDGRVRAAVSGPVHWRQALQSSDWTWASAASVEETVAFTADGLPFSVAPDGDFTAHTVFESHVSELRSWSDSGGRGTRMAACFPELGKIRTGLVPAGRGPDWWRYMTKSFGPAVSTDADFLAHPVSLDGAPDGRLYVLDAGNSRIVAFDADGQYITQWGRRGAGPGEFDFGLPNRIPKGLDYSGSVAVDGEGRIYVAEVANQRIQVFAP